MSNASNISSDTPIQLIKTSSTLDVRPIHPKEVQGSRLDKYLSSMNKLNNDEKIDLLRRINLCLGRLHQEHIVCQPLSPSKIYLEKIIGSLAKKFKLNTSPNNIEKRKYLNALSDLYCYVLTNGEHEAYNEKLVFDDDVCSDAYTAKNLITLLRKDISPDTDVVFKHPFQWSDLGKATFICNAVEFLLSKRGGSTKFDQVLKNYKMHDLKCVYVGDVETPWKDKLELNRSDIRRIKESQPEDPPEDDGIEFEKSDPGNSMIYDLAAYDYRKNDLISLLCFFRNSFVHYHKDTFDIKAAFGSYPSGYLRFFTSRYPKMFMHVYENMKEHLPKIDSGENHISSSSVNIVCYTA